MAKFQTDPLPIIAEGKVASEPEALISWFASLGVSLARVGLEAGPLSQGSDEPVSPRPIYACTHRYSVAIDSPQRSVA